MTRWVICWTSGPHGPHGGGDLYVRVDVPGYGPCLDHLTLYYQTREQAERILWTITSVPVLIPVEVVLPKTVSDWILNDLYNGS